MKTSEILQWTTKELSSLLGFEQVESIAQKMLELADDQDALLAFVIDILGDDNSSMSFLEAFLDLFQSLKESSLTNFTNGKGKALKVFFERPKVKNKPKPPRRAREACDCNGRTHEVYTNCLECGRILCEREGEGECAFCGHFVSLHHSVELNEEAEALRNKLLQISQKGTVQRVIDDQRDFYDLDDVANNQWLDSDERKAATVKAEQREAVNEAFSRPFRRPIRVHLDIKGQKFVEETEIEKPEETPKVLQKTPRLTGNALQVYHSLQKALEPTPIPTKPTTTQNERTTCISIHQPWASLLVLGIKQVEGREWSTTHRGRLWIASTSKKPSELEIATVEDQYIQFYRLPRDQIPFPKHYPTSSLLGCVHVDDCLSQSQYQHLQNTKALENTEFSYVWLCSSPQQLVLPCHISGKRKLWHMDSETARNCSKGLDPVDTTWKGP